MILMRDHYKNQLTACGQEIYDRIESNIHCLAKNAYVELNGGYSAQNLKDAVKAYLALREDRPEFYFMDNKVEAVVSSKGILNIRQSKRFSFDQIKRINAILRREVAGILEMSLASDDLTKEKNIYKNIASRYHYKDGDLSHDLSGLLIFKEGVCESLAGMLVITLREAGIPACKINGIARNSRHSWTKAWINGVAYHLDVTWDLTNKSPFARYRYFNVTESMIRKDHIIETG